MAVHTSVIKRARQNRKIRQRNRMWKSQIRTAQGRIEKAIVDKDTNALQEFYRQYCSLLDKASSRRIIHRNNASRKKTGMARRIRSLQPTQ